MSDQENLPVAVEAPFMPMKLAKIKDAIGYIEQFVKDVLIEGKHGSGDYGVIPGTGSKPTLFKSGAEKLCMAFSLSPEYEIIDKVEDDEAGWYSYSVKCTLANRETGIVWATQIGRCDSGEKGRDKASANTCLKMAQKRAYVGATLNATMTSDRFTCDVEDGGHQKSGAQQTTDDSDAPDGMRKMAA